MILRDPFGFITYHNVSVEWARLMNDAGKNSTFRKLVKVPLSVNLTELGLQGFTGYLSVVGRTDKGEVAIDVDFISGAPVRCVFELLGEGWRAEGIRCLEIVESTICVECFAEIRKLRKDKVKVDESLLRTPRRMVGEATMRVGPERLAEDFNKLSNYLVNPAVLANLTKASRTATVMKARLRELIDRLLAMASSYPLSVIATNHGVKVIALAREHGLVALCVWRSGSVLCGDDALEYMSSDGADVVVNAIVSYVDSSALLPPLKEALT